MKIVGEPLRGPGAVSSPQRPLADDDDPWTAVSRTTLTSIQRNKVTAKGLADLGDTAERIYRPLKAIDVHEGPTLEILDFLNHLIEVSPDRADLWMMRFETLEGLGLKSDFLAGLEEAWRNHALRRQLDPGELGRLWSRLAPSTPLPAGIVLPATGDRPAVPGPLEIRSPQRSTQPARQRRFADIAVRIARNELAALSCAYAELRRRPRFLPDFAHRVGHLLQRPTPLHFAAVLTQKSGGEHCFFLKREDQRTVTAEKENAIAQAYVARALGKKLLITGNDVDEHTLALAGAALEFGMGCIVVLSPLDLEAKPVFAKRLRDAGAWIESTAGMCQLTNDPREAALRFWKPISRDAHLALSLGTGPAPYPEMISDLRALLGHETGLQLRAYAKRARRAFVAAVHSEADSIGFILPHIAHPTSLLAYAEPEDPTSAWLRSARLAPYHGARREHMRLRTSNRIAYTSLSDAQAFEAQLLLLKLEGLNAGLEDARALALAQQIAQQTEAPSDIVVLIA